MKISEQTRSSTGSGSENYEKITDSMKKKFCLKEFIFSFYHITRLALSVTIIVLISQTTLKSIKENSSYLRIQENVDLWSKNVIIDMITVSTYNCPKGYEPYTSARWEGTKEGCLCSTSLNQYDYVHVLPGQCTMKLINAGCTRIDPEKSIPFVFWKTQKLMCVKRINRLNFFSKLSQTLKSSQIQTCAKGTNYQINSLSAQGCPITSISNQTNYQNILPDLNFSFIRESSYPIIDIKMTEYSFCLEYNRPNISPNRFQNYGLQILEISNCLEDNDQRVKEIDQITEKQLFENNKRILDVITNVLPAYPRPTDKFVYKLGTVEYPAWTKNCRDSTEYNLLKTKQALTFDQTISKAQSCLALTIVMVLIWGLVYSLICIIKRVIQIRSEYKKGILCYPKYIILRIDPNLLNNKLKLSIFSEIVLFLFLLAVAIGLLVQLGVQYQYTSSMEEWMRGSYGCMDNEGYFQKLVYETYVVTLQASIRTYLICLLSALVGVFIDLVFLVWRFNRGDLSSQKIQNIFKNDDLQEKNSDQKIQVQDQNLINQKQPNKEVKIEDIVEDDIEIDREYNKEEQQGSQVDNPFQKRQKTTQIDIQEMQASQREAQIMSKRFKPRSNLRKNNTIGVSRAGNNPIHNPTEQSLVAMHQDDLQFNKITLESSYRKQRKLPRNKKRLQSFDFQQDE